MPASTVEDSPSCAVVDEWLMDEDERRLTSDADYWERMGSAMSAEPSYDAYDLIADQVEAAFTRAADKQFRHLMPKRPTRRREPKQYSDDAVGNLRCVRPSACAPHNPVVPRPSPPQREVTLDADRVDSIVRRVLTSLDSTGEDSVPRPGKGLVALPEKDLRTLYDAYQHMLILLGRSHHLGRRYGKVQGEHPYVNTPWTIGDDVPNYFANVGSESAHYRKVLSVCGLRNLVSHGQEIYSQLLATHFSGNPQQYSGDSGINRMRRVTGNTVDLDTVVLRCSSHLTLAAINSSNRLHGLPLFASAQEFGSSQQAEAIAATCAEVAIGSFLSKFPRMSEAEMKRRNIHCATQLVSSQVPIARDNNSRGQHPLWHYINVGQDSFHANVPCMADVVGALLRAPFAAIGHYAKLFTVGDLQGAESLLTLCTDPATLLTTDQEAALASSSMIEMYFDQCIADSCFNGTWKSIEEYGSSVEHRGTVEDVLQRLQQQHQDLFPPSLFDSDDAEHSEEVRRLWSVAQGHRGRDTSSAGSGRVRGIRLEDVKDLVSRQAAL